MTIKRRASFKRKGAAIAFLTLKGYQNIKVEEISCIPRNGDPACEYILEGTPSPSIIHKLKNALFSMFRDRNAIVQYMEENHRALQSQYQEILSMRDFYSHIMDSMGEAILWLRRRMNSRMIA